MNIELLELLRCPISNQKLQFENLDVNQDFVNDGYLITKDGKYKYPIINNIPRFVDQTNYADNFGLQWNIFSKTQLDSYSEYPISSDRFWNATNWAPNELKDQWVLDVGCGAGRFAEILLDVGAKIIALDYSSSVDACYENLKHHANLHVVQGDIYSLPFQKDFFPFVYSLGVLQHTPDVEKAFYELPLFIKKNGKLCVDYYQKSWKSYLLPKYWLRPLTKRIKNPKLFSFLRIIVPILYPLSWVVGKLPYGHLLKRLIPVADPLYYYEIENTNVSFSYSRHLEWSLLDTFDWFSPEHDNPQTHEKVQEMMKNANMNSIEILKAGHLVARGTK
jgi:SAM-dependent methyltransferase